MFKKTIKLMMVLGLLYSCTNTPSKEKNSEENAENKGISKKEITVIFEKSIEHLQNNWKQVKTSGKLPRSKERGFKNISDWTSGFYPGSLWISYEATKEEGLLKKAQFATELLEEEKYNTKDHDIGFRIYCSYGRGYQLTKSPVYKEVIIQAAKSAIQRYDPRVKAIMSWEARAERDWQYPVIIDNMMNLELLFAASKLTGDATFYDVAINHANTTLENQYRKDFSCSHVVDLDSITGGFRKRDWNNGNSDPSTAAWSRGQSWGLYGFTMMYRETGDKRYLNHAENIAKFILENPNMPTDMVPYWDYNAPEYPTVRDASAAAILASGLMELSTLSIKNKTIYFEAGEQILKSLSSPAYFAAANTNGNYLLKHATGNFVRNSEIDGTLIYADYYFLEGLSRYLKLKYNSDL